VILVALASLATGLLLATGVGLTQRATAERFWTEPQGNPGAGVAIPGRPESFAALVRGIKGAVVNINTTKRVRLPKDHPDLDAPTGEGRDPHDFFDRFFGGRERDLNQRNMGSGVILHPDGYIVTNEHVVADTDAIQVRLSTGKRYRAEVIGKDPKTDLALIKIRPETPLPVVPMGDSDRLEVGDWVLAIGNPFGFDHSVTAGIVSGKGRVLGSGPYDDYIQTDAAINPGNSGGPLFNLRGEVVGIATAIIPRSQFGFAIPSNQAKRVLLQLKERGKVSRGWLGVVVKQVPSSVSGSPDLMETPGALVSEVLSDSPAERAGIRPGDVILQFGGRTVREVRDLPRMVAETPVGSEAEVGIQRDRKAMTVRIRLGELRDERLARLRPPEAPLGLVVQDLTPELAKDLGVPSGPGIAVAHVSPGSPADEAGMRPGDVILEVNRRAVKARDEFETILRQQSGESSLLFLVRRREGTRFIALKAK
jgi:serine protease Do